MTTRYACLLLSMAVLSACGESKPKTPADSAAMPTPATTSATAPAVFRARFETSKGPFVVELHRDWSPNGVDRFYQLVKSGFFENVRFFRVVPGFMAQFGIHGDPAVARMWEPLRIQDDPVTQSNKRGYVSFATAGPNTRTTQLFINYRDNPSLDGIGFSPVGMVVEGMAVVDSLYGGYGDAPPDGQGPDQGRLHSEGNAYLEKEFPKLDFIRTARLETTTTADSTAKKS